MQYVATSDPEAYDYYLRGRRYMYSMARRDYEHAIRMFEQAIRVDSQVRAGLCRHGRRVLAPVPLRRRHGGERGTQANRASEQALVLDPASAEAHASRGLALLIGEQYDEADKEFDTAITLNPNLFEAWYYYGLACSSQGDHEKAAQLYTRATEVNPADFQVPMFLAQTYASLGRSRTRCACAWARCHAGPAHQAESARHARALLDALNLYRVGEKQRAIANWPSRPCSRTRTNRSCSTTWPASTSIQGDHERAIELLEKAVAWAWATARGSRHDSDLDPLHGHPRFAALLAKIGPAAAVA